MGASLPDSGLHYWLSATRARVAGLLIDLELVLKISTAVNPVYTGAVGFNSARKGEPDRLEQSDGSFKVNFFTGLQRVDASPKKSFVRIDVSQACYEGLVE